VTALRYAPEFKLAINDADLPPALRSAVTSVRYEDGTQAADRVEIGLANPDLRWLQSHIRGLGFRPFPTGIRVGPAGVSEGPAEGAFDIDNKVALSLGGTCEGPPGPRGTGGFYAAYFRDPEGNKLNAYVMG